jgi:hypothetical protein
MRATAKALAQPLKQSMQNFNLIDNCGGLRAFCRTGKERALQIPEFLQAIAALGEFALRELDLVQVVARLVFRHLRPPPAKLSGRICLIGCFASEALIYRNRMPAPNCPRCLTGDEFTATLQP